MEPRELLDIAGLAPGEFVVTEQDFRLCPPGFFCHGLHLAPAVETASLDGGTPQLAPTRWLHAAGPGQFPEFRQVVVNLVRPVMGPQEKTAQGAFGHASRVADFR